MVNVTGWDLLMQGHPVSAVYTLYNVAFFGWAVAIIFLLLQGLLWYKTKSPQIPFIVGVLIIATVAGAGQLSSTGEPYIKGSALAFVFVILVLDLMAIIYEWFR